MEGTNFTDKSCTSILRLPRLQNLKTYNTSITAKGRKQMVPHPKLQSLSTGGAIGDEGVAVIANGFPSLTDMSAWNTGITDVGDEELSRMSRLKSLLLSSNKISSKGVASLSNLQNLEFLDIWGMHTVTDEAIGSLSSLPKLATRRLGSSSATDAGLVHLKLIKTLKQIDLTNTKVTEAGVRDLQQAPPDCGISWDDTQPPSSLVESE